jgi:CDP-diacylglycerol---glycerol-3-phosphate 3-phosphatidyltransferase
MAGDANLRAEMIRRYYYLMEKAAKPLVRMGISAAAITVAGLIFSFAAGIFLVVGDFFRGGLFMLFSALMDPLDGTVARLSGRATRFGALLDSTLDRYAEFFIFFGFLVHFNKGWMFYAVLLALMGSIMVSYVKARAESLGQTKVVGLMQRPERIVLLLIGTLFNWSGNLLVPSCSDWLIKGILIILALLSNITAVHRLFVGKKELA